MSSNAHLNDYELYVNGCIKLDLSNRPLKDTNLLYNELSKINITCQESITSQLINSLQHFVSNNNDLMKVPQIVYLFPSLANLDLSFNSITAIPEDIVKLIKLQILNVSNNLIVYLPIVFGRLKYLKYLNIADNKLKNLPENLHYLTHLKYLDVSNNLLEYLPCKMPFNLIEINVSNNLLYGLPDNLSKLKKLSILNLSFNQFHSIPSIIRNPNMKICLLNDNNIHITSLFEDCFNVFMLETLDISNKVTWQQWSNFIPLNFGSIDQNDKKNKRTTGNWLKNVPKNFFYSFVQLSELNLRKLILTILPDSICYLKMLKILKLGDNHLEYLPENFGDLIMLENLELSRNVICYLPESFSNLVNLVYLDLCHNKIFELPSYFSNFKLLKKIDLYSNSLNEIPDFLDNLQLEFVDFSRNNFYFELKDLSPKVLQAFSKSKGFNELPMKEDISLESTDSDWSFKDFDDDEYENNNDDLIIDNNFNENNDFIQENICVEKIDLSFNQDEVVCDNIEETMVNVSEHAITAINSNYSKNNDASIQDCFNDHIIEDNKSFYVDGRNLFKLDNENIYLNQDINVINCNDLSSRNISVNESKRFNNNLESYKNPKGISCINDVNHIQIINNSPYNREFNKTFVNNYKNSLESKAGLESGLKCNNDEMFDPYEKILYLNSSQNNDECFERLTHFYDPSIIHTPTFTSTKSVTQLEFGQFDN